MAAQSIDHIPEPACTHSRHTPALVMPSILALGQWERVQKMQKPGYLATRAVEAITVHGGALDHVVHQVTGQGDDERGGNTGAPG
ncbi:hypothetical protein [Thermomonospora umbrina]|uniref:hypothetical protein n=1 Tax=Thermomonospora umbrina TaxID=111806 RepID=UPI000E24C729|nr:hypothetical protein [Thermomonospora umbrina]